MGPCGSSQETCLWSQPLVLWQAWRSTTHLPLQDRTLCLDVRSVVSCQPLAVMFFRNYFTFRAGFTMFLGKCKPMTKQSSFLSTPPSEGQQGPGTSTQLRAPLRCSVCWELLLDRQRLLDLHFCLPTPTPPPCPILSPFSFHRCYSQ